MIKEEEGTITESLLTEEQRSSTTTESSASSAVLDSLVVPKMSIHRGQFVSVIGRVGSGKSTFLSSILGEIDKFQGTFSRRGTIAYIPQTSWLRSATIKENIIF